MSAVLPPKREARKPKGSPLPGRLAIPPRELDKTTRSDASLAAPPSHSPNPFVSSASDPSLVESTRSTSSGETAPKRPALSISSIGPTSSSNSLSTTASHSIYPSTVASIDPDAEDGGKIADPDKIIGDIQKAMGGVSVSSSADDKPSPERSARPVLHARTTSSASGAPKVPRPGTGDGSAGQTDRVCSLTSTTGGKSPAENGDGEGAEEEVEVQPEDLEELDSLGEGASGAVVKVRHRPTGLVLAKKTVSTSPNPSVHRQTLRELAFNRQVAGSGCDCIVKYYGAFLEEQNTQIAILMEYAEGGSLDAINRRITSHGGRIGEKILGKVAASVLTGLAYLHRHKIIHRDIKPSNILVTKQGLVKLCDLGVSGELVLSMAKTFMGTSMYMAPERITGKEYNIRSDVWSLGLSLLELALGRHPIAAPDGSALQTFELVQAILTFQMPSFAAEESSGHKWSKGFQHFVTICLERDPTERYTPEDLLQHPWITRCTAMEADLSKWVAGVWGWS